MTTKEFQLTETGLPNTCTICGKAQKNAWYARNEDEARSGLGRCAKDAGYSSRKAAKTRGRPKKKEPKAPEEQAIEPSSPEAPETPDAESTS